MWPAALQRHCLQVCIHAAVGESSLPHQTSDSLEARLVELFEVRVRHRRLGRDALARLVPEHLREEIQTVYAELGRDGGEGDLVVTQ